MNFALRQSLKIFITSVVILIIAMVVFYKLNYNSFLNYELDETKVMAEKISRDIDQHLIEKVKKTKTIVAAPVITEALCKSNEHYKSLSNKKRDEEILQKNNKWMTIKDQNNSFILDYTNNEASKYLKILQHNIKGEYGEIFLTNKYGALVASTAKLTTFAHGHKCWWQGAFNDGNGAVFLDDRGYDDSVDGYVLGVVVPIKKDNEIIGILKANLNIVGSINSIIINSQIKDHEKLKLIRSGGLIVFEEGTKPLSKRISDDLQNEIQAKPNKSFVFATKGEKFVVGCSEIKISSEMEGYNFGGDFESIDHKKGNRGESWLILDLNPFSNVIKQTTEMVSGLWFIGILLTIVFAITSLIIGKRSAKPLKELIIQTRRITKGDYDAKISLNRTDEIGLLALSFNQMSNYLKKSTTSIDKLNAEIKERVQAEEKIKEKSIELEKQFQKNEEQRIATLTILSDLTETTRNLRVEISVRKQAEEQIKKDLKEKTALLQELYHRTKNNMQVVRSMLKIQLRNIDNRILSGDSGSDYMHDSFNAIINKIKAMSLVHEKLYQAEDLSHINLREYIGDLVRYLLRSYSIRTEKIILNMELEEVFVLIDSAIPLGLVLNEIISNVFKHAFPHTKKDELFIKLYKEDNETIHIQLNDNGVVINIVY